MPIRRNRSRIDSRLINPSISVILFSLVTLALLPSWQIIFNEHECELGKEHALKDFTNDEVGRYVGGASYWKRYAGTSLLCGTGRDIPPYSRTKISEDCYRAVMDSLIEAKNISLDSLGYLQLSDHSKTIICTALDFPKVRPQYVSGEEQLLTFLSDNIVYPPLAIKDSLKARFMWRFAIDTLGNVCSTQIIKGVRADLDSAALIAVLKTSGNWLPAMQAGRKVNAYFYLPVNFKLKDD